MKKAFSIIPDLSNEALEILCKSGVSLDIAENGFLPKTDEVIELLQKYDILITGVRTNFPKEILNHISSKKVIATLSIGTDHIANEVKNSPMVTVISLKDANVISVAEHIFSLILALNKRLYESNKLVIDGRGNRNNLYERPEDISNKKLGLIGAGNITKEVIRIAKVFNMDMVCYTRNSEAHKDFLEYGVIFKSLEEVLRESDIINVSVPLTEDTRLLINDERIKLIKNTATFINTSRTDIVDNEALIRKADLYGTFYVGLDIDLDNYVNLFSKYRNNVIVSPHIAGVSKQAIARMDYELASKIKDFLKKEEK